MNISKFFIDRPIFAGVLSVLVLLAGLLAMFQLPISEYPEVVPPSVVVRAQYPGANPKVIAETVASPLEESINGVENMLYMQSQANSDGNLTLTVNFKLGVDPDKAQQLVQNRVSQALPRLPPDVQRLGVTTAKSSPTLTLVVHLISPNDRYDITYLRNYAILNVKDRLARITGVGEVTVWGSGNYSMRVWLDPQKVAQRRDRRRSGQRHPRAERAGRRRRDRRLAHAGRRAAAAERERARPPADRGGVPRHHPEDLARRRRDAPVRRGARGAGRPGIRPALAAGQQAGGGHGHHAVARRQRAGRVHRCARPWPSWPRTFPRRGIPHRVRPHPVRQRQHRGGGSRCWKRSRWWFWW